MADYIYLLENRLSLPQRNALRQVREVARAKAMTLFLVGGAVRDLTSGSPIRDLDVVVQGNASKLKKDLEKVGAIVAGESEVGQALYVSFPGGVRMEVGSTLSVTFPKPGKAVTRPATILEDLRRRDFTANAMALSLNEGSYGLLMDPLNGVADIENRQLRLVSNYGFIEDPVRMIRAARLMARLGWTLDEKTQTRYETGKQEEYVSAMPEFHRGYETEEIVHEEDPLRILRRLEAEGWMKILAPYWTVAKVNVNELERLREVQSLLQMQGIHPQTAAANFPLLTAKLSAKEITTLKAGFPRQGFVAEIDALENEAKEFAAQLGGKASASPSHAWKLLTSAKPEAVLWVAYTTKSAALQAKFKSFYTEWPQARQKMPYTMMQEMRIVPDLAGYDDLLEKLFFQLMDGKLSTPEEMKEFLEPYSPPAPPPPVSMRRLRTPKKESKPAKSRAKKSAKTEAEEGEETSEGIEAPAATSASEPADVTPIAAPKPARKPASTVELPAKAAQKEPIAKLPLSKTSEGKKASPPNFQHPRKAITAAPPASKARSVAAKEAAGKKSERTPAKTSAPGKTPPAKGAPLKSLKAAQGKRPLTKSKPAANSTKPINVASKKLTKPAAKPAAKKTATKVSARPTPKPASKFTSKPAPKKAVPAGKSAKKTVATKSAKRR